MQLGISYTIKYYKSISLIKQILLMSGSLLPCLPYLQHYLNSSCQKTKAQRLDNGVP